MVRAMRRAWVLERLSFPSQHPSGVWFRRMSRPSLCLLRPT
jgi:hypothetical protein